MVSRGERRDEASECAAQCSRSRVRGCSLGLFERLVDLTWVLKLSSSSLAAVAGACAVLALSPAAHHPPTRSLALQLPRDAWRQLTFDRFLGARIIFAIVAAAARCRSRVGLKQTVLRNLGRVYARGLCEESSRRVLLVPCVQSKCVVSCLMPVSWCMRWQIVRHPFY